MRILAFSNCPPVAQQGSGYVVTNFCQGLQQRGHEVDLIGPDVYEILQWMRGRANSYRQAVGMAAYTLRQLRRKPYDIIEFYGAQAWLTILLLRLLPRRGILLVSHSNGVEPHVVEVMDQYRHLLGQPRKWYQLEQTPLFKQAFTRVDGLVTVSHYDGNYVLRKQYLPGSRLQVIENPLPENFLRLPLSESREKTVGFCGAWLPRKGTELIKAALPRLLEEFPDWSFKLIGVGHGFRKKAVFPARVCPQIEVIPFVKDKLALRQIYQSLKILIVPSIYESFGLVTAEAMACGCAVVASPTGFAANLNSGDEALILDTLTPAALFHAIRDLMIDGKLRQHIARRGYERVQQLQWDAAVRCLEETYQRWLWDFRSNQTQ